MGGGVGQTIAAAGGAYGGTQVIEYLAQWLHMPPMNDAVAGAFAILLAGAVHIVAAAAKKRWGVDIEAPPDAPTKEA